MNNLSIETLFAPSSVAVVGVSEQPQKIGSVVYDNMRDAGFKGKLFPVNPKHTSLRGVPCYPSVSAIPDDVDTVCIAVPAQHVEGVLLDATKKKVKTVVVISSGFGEQGSEGKEREQKLLTICKENGIRLLGPNCLGSISTADKVNLSFTAVMPQAGGIAVFSQSGAICTALLDAAAEKGIGFSHLVSVGNESDISELDLLDYFQNSPAVKVIAAYIEEVKHGNALFTQYARYKNPKPFIVIKPGKTKAARNAMQSHTGSIASELSTFHTAAKQYGLIPVNSLQELLTYAITFERQKRSCGNRVAVITNAGGPGILATDALITAGFEMPLYSEETQSLLKEKLPPTASVKNPLDLGGDALADRYELALTTLANDPHIDQILTLLTPQFVTQIDETSKSILAHGTTDAKPIYPVYLGGKYTANGLAYLFDKQRIGYASIEEAVTAMKAVQTFEVAQQNGAQHKEQPQVSLHSVPATPLEFTENGTLSTENTKLLLQEFSIPLPAQMLCASLEEALSFLSEYHLVVLKLSNEFALHKTEKKGVIKGIDSSEKLTSAWNELTSGTPLLIQQQIIADQELFIGAQKDPSGIGHLLIFGKGGIETEVYKDFGYVVVPAEREDIIKQLASTKVSKTLVGFRGKKALAVTAFVKLIEQIQSLLQIHPEIDSVDFNPILITEESVFAVDAKILRKV